MADRATAAQPKGILMQLLADSLGFERILALIKRLQHFERRANQMIVGEDAAEASDPFIGVNGNKCVNTIVRLQFVTPSAFRRRAAQTRVPDLSYFHSACSTNNYCCTQYFQLRSIRVIVVPKVWRF